ncbi:MAG: DUF3336 domain-containing protein [Bacteroidota bacterium]
MINIFSRKSKQIQQLEEADSYEEWLQLAENYDQATGMAAWKQVEYSDLYDNVEIKLRLNKLRTMRKKGDDQGLLFLLNEGIHGNMGGMGNPKLHTKALSGTKQLITDYVDEIVDALEHLADMNNHSIHFDDKLDFFRRASLCFGRSALMLSGGGQIGNFHMGVLKALTKEDLLPDVISGASAGSLYAALVGTHTNEELLDFFAKDQIVDVLKREAKIYEKIAEQKSVKVKDLEIILENVIPDITFQEAFHRTGRKINISIAPHGAQQKSRLLNAIASPNVLIRSAVMASCAVPGIFPPVTLSAKNKDGETRPYLPSRKWIDGSMSNDLPSKRLTRLYQVNHFIVSLTNPLVLPFVMDPSQQEGRLAPVRRFGMAIMKETTQFNYSIAKRFFKYAPSVALFANNVNSIVQQNYLGDINILADFSVLNARKVLSSWTFEELNELIRKGEKATWSKIEAIRVTTKIGRTLDDILEAYEAKEMALANGVLNE